ncbi:MAG TPA: choice-of-anchor C family protein [Gemmata sp.]|nr:choice-of-anchor C family protein [Gemmata sp.]
MIITRFFLFAFGLGLLILPAARTADNKALPPDAEKKIKECNRDIDVIQKKADDEIRARRKKLLAELKQLQESYTKAGKLESAIAIRDRIKQLVEEASGANLLINGSFEEGPMVGGFGWQELRVGSQEIKGWVVTRGPIDYEGAAIKHADGNRSVDLHGSNSVGGIKQTFATRSGRKYRVIFSLGGNPEGGPPVKLLGVYAAGRSTKFSFDTTGKKRDDIGWKTETWEFTATASKTSIEFASLMQRPDSWGPLVDNVSVAEIIE